MRYQAAERLVHLALEMRASQSGLSITEIMDRFKISRRTAVRLRDAVVRAFAGSEHVRLEGKKKLWRLDGDQTDQISSVTADDLATLETAAVALEKNHLPHYAETLRALGSKIRCTIDARSLTRIEPDLELLLEAEGIARRPGPRPVVPPKTFEILRDAIKASCMVSFDYDARSVGGEKRRLVCPLGLVYGHRHYLVALEKGQRKPKFFSLPKMSSLKKSRETSEIIDFDLGKHLQHNFGVFEEAPSDIVWRFDSEAAPVARQFLFHPTQRMTANDDGSLTVEFRAGGMLEMAWHLLTWGSHVEVLKPIALRSMLPKTMPHWQALP